MLISRIEPARCGNRRRFTSAGVADDVRTYTSQQPEAGTDSFHRRRRSRPVITSTRAIAPSLAPVQARADRSVVVGCPRLHCIGEADDKSVAIRHFHLRQRLPSRDRNAIEQSLVRLANNWEQLQRTHLQKLSGLSSKHGHSLLQLRDEPDLRVPLYRVGERIVVVDIVRHSQIERLRSGR